MRTNFATDQESTNQKGMKAGKGVLIRRAEWVVALLLTVIVLFLIVVRVTHAGALWRDECETLQVSRMPTLAEIHRTLEYTSLPLPFVLLLRDYTSVFGTTDFALRAIGLVV